MNLLAVCPLNGRYQKQTKKFAHYFSEFALIKHRIFIEINYFIALSEKAAIIRPLTSKEKKYLQSIIADLNLKEAQKVKNIEKTLNHDVKAVEYYLKRNLKKTSLKDVLEMVHFGLTSEDVNNLSFSLCLKKALSEIYFPRIKKFLKDLIFLIRKYKDTPMLARTHGQPAVPTTVGKELANFAWRLYQEAKILKAIKIKGKLNGAVGNFNAHHAAFPLIDWLKFSKEFIISLGLEPDLITSQIQPYDSWVRAFDSLKRLNNILLGFSQDIWRYISDGYFVQKSSKKEIGSSTMPHKVNPINFEQAEAHLGIANAFLEFFSRKLLISRLQRDLSDSAVRREIGQPITHSYLALSYLLRGLEKLKINEKKINAVLNENWQIISEGVQTILRSEKYAQPYELIKKLTRGKTLTKGNFNHFIEKLKIAPEIKKRLKNLSPFNYLGESLKLTEIALKNIGNQKCL